MRGNRRYQFGGDEPKVVAAVLLFRALTFLPPVFIEPELSTAMTRLSGGRMLGSATRVELSPSCSKVQLALLDNLSKGRIDVGIGNVTVVQEIGFKEFRRVNPEWKGSRKITLTLPVLNAARRVVFLALHSNSLLVCQDKLREEPRCRWYELMSIRGAVPRTCVS